MSKNVVFRKISDREYEARLKSHGKHTTWYVHLIQYDRDPYSFWLITPNWDKTAFVDMVTTKKRAFEIAEKILSETGE